MPKIKYKEFNFRDSTLRLIDQANQMPIIFHFGDHDPSGKDMSRDIQDRLELFTGRMIRFERLALNMDQVKEYDPPPNPAKITDSRAEGYIAEFGDESWELDALEPAVLETLVREAIEGIVDRDKMNDAEALQDQHRATLSSVSDNWEQVTEFVSNL